ncbi:hypothetical protein ACB092_07G047300 [Castanea dentata]
MPQDLPGFYYDKEKNRYFPIKSRTPGSRRFSSLATAQEPTPKSTRALNLCRRTGLRASKQLPVRELYGNIIPFSKVTLRRKSKRYKYHILWYVD